MNEDDCWEKVIERLDSYLDALHTGHNIDTVDLAENIMGFLSELGALK